MEQLVRSTLAHPSAISQIPNASIPPAGNFTSGPSIPGGSMLPPGINGLKRTRARNVTGASAHSNDSTACHLYLKDSTKNPATRGSHEVTFVHTDPRAVGRIATPGTGWSWSFLNYKLKSAMDGDCGGLKYKDVTHGRVIMKDIPFYGIHGADPADWQRRNKDVGIQKFIVGRRARVPNLWMAQAHRRATQLGTTAGARVGDGLWILLRRYRATDPLDGAFGTKTEVKPEARKRCRLEGSTYPKPVDAPSDDDDDDASSSAKSLKYYWQFEPYVSTDGTPPPSYLYINGHSTGEAIFIGTVTDSFGNHKIKGLEGRAREALRPETDSGEHVNKLRTIPEIEIQTRHL